MNEKVPFKLCESNLLTKNINRNKIFFADIKSILDVIPYFNQQRTYVFKS